MNGIPPSICICSPTLRGLSADALISQTFQIEAPDLRDQRARRASSRRDFLEAHLICIDADWPQRHLRTHEIMILVGAISPSTGGPQKRSEIDSPPRS